MKKAKSKESMRAIYKKGDRVLVIKGKYTMYERVIIERLHTYVNVVYLLDDGCEINQIDIIGKV